MSKITAVELDVKDATSLVISAIEGGTGYWAECKGYKWRNWYVDADAKYGEENYDKLREIPRDEVLVWIREDEENGETYRDSNKWFGITIENLEKALCTALATHGHLYQFRGQEIDTDATGADVVFQLAIFGEVVFG